MTSQWTVLARIILRYGSGALVSLGILAPDLASEIGADPDLVLLLGAALGAGVEFWYAFARKAGGAT